jgi:hypothetical protein
MTEIIDHINEQIENCIEDVRTYGLCHLIEDDSGEQYPSLIGSSSIKISPDDQYSILIYHRFLNGDYSPNEDLSFGRRVTAHNQQQIRTVVIIDIDTDLSVIDDIVNALPDDFEIEGYKLVSVSKNVNLIRDSNSVWSQEFSEAYRDKYIKRYNIYSLEYGVQYVKCATCEPIPPSETITGVNFVNAAVQTGLNSIEVVYVNNTGEGNALATDLIIMNCFNTVTETYSSQSIQRQRSHQIVGGPVPAGTLPGHLCIIYAFFTRNGSMSEPSRIEVIAT